jgi:Tol biopolymer transport system component
MTKGQYLKQISSIFLCFAVSSGAANTVWAEDASDPAAELRLIGNARQLTFEGRRAGEGYFSQDGRRMVFQSERDPANPFFQIFLLDLETGDVERVSPGHGKTTCAWIHPDDRRVLFASTHEDVQAEEKQQQELETRAAGKERRYSWDYDENFDLYVYDRETKSYRNLTQTLGYDAEGCYSPDGSKIVFASNRSAYAEPLDEKRKALFEIDKATFNEIYICDADGSNVQRLTHTFGYDGGPFFSPDGQRICWRRFSTDGATAEIMTMNIDGSDQRQLTNLGAMSWAPFYHPSGEYLIFTTNKHGFANFELYLVDVEGQHEPVRVTYTDGFDGLPTFSPDGNQLAWTSNRTSNQQSQIFLATWNHDEALQLLRGTSGDSDVTGDSSRQVATASLQSTTEDFSPDDILKHVDYLCRQELQGRLTGSPGEKQATAYVAAYLDGLGFQPAGDDGGWFQEFEFTSGVALGDNNELNWGADGYQVDVDWRPLAFSKTGAVDAAEVVFAGYGIVAPKDEDEDNEAGAEYDSYVHLDVKDKWVMVFRYMPDDISAERRQHLSRYSHPRFKAMVARDRGARGLIIVSGPRSKVKQQLLPLRFDGSLAGASLPVISVTDRLAEQWLAAADKQLDRLQARLDTGEPVMGVAIPDHLLSATISIQRVKKQGRNVLGRLPVNDGQMSEQLVMVGAHIDHLGRGGGGSSLAKEDEANQIHVGADDNASGVAAILEMAQYLAASKRGGNFSPRRDVIFAAWSGEELGLLGSSHFAKRLAELQVTTPAQPADHADAGPREDSDGPSDNAKQANSLYPGIAACINLDMVGRLEKKLVLQGIGSSPTWSSVIERRNVPVGLPITLQQDSYVPSDASTFFSRGVPSLTAFTGSHSEYHTPRDTPDKLNYDGAAQIARLMALIVRELAESEDAPQFVPQLASESNRPRARMRAYLGTIPDYAEADVSGVMLSGVSGGGPAGKAGVQGGDVIVELAGKKIENIYDYTYAIEALKIGDPVKMVVLRNDKRVTLEVTPGSRD